MRIGIIGAMDNEISHILESMFVDYSHEYCGYKFYIGVMGRNDVVLVKCGVGKVNAARCAQILIDKFDIDIMLNTGVAGAVNPLFKIGDVIVPYAVVQHDFDVTCLGYAKGYMCTGVGRDKPTMYYSDKVLNENIFSKAKELAGEASVYDGILATGDIFISDVKMKDKIRSKFDASAVEMESGAIAQTCSMSGVPFAILRVISDEAGGEVPKEYQRFEDAAADISSRIMVEIVKDISSPCVAD